ncbi:dipeptide transport system permease protein [Thiothrix eikelboomii]|uniref:Dipeptide transport system permease protein n=1 Tax=Thiothrix eikelboomii TaxID=92487 RepID=A0A1T4XC62_9GAMM|nr:ABC transporter permease subunit [Thiothrix eikelboomii]SKA87144.1 dipeptide transport system permease protein [Thiothrix eikelboomii]
MKLFADEAWRTTWLYFKESKGGLWGLSFLGIVLFCVVFADLIAPFDPSLQNRSALLLPPIWTEAGHWPYILGTDAVGRDLLSRLIYGARYSMFIGFVVVSLAVIIGTLLGLLAGYYSGWLDTLIMRLMDVILAFPSLLLALGLVAVLGPGLLNAMYAIALVMLPHFVRLTRANVLSEKNRDYVIASRIVGASNRRLMFNTILPNCMAPLIVQATLSFSNAILDAAALGFLGMGAQPPLPEWGAMLAEAREFISRAWWVVTFPGLAILLTVLSINLVGDALRDALDPRMRRS